MKAEIRRRAGPAGKRERMPFYEFICGDCQHQFEVRASISEMQAGKITCPQCGGADLRRVFGRVGGSGCGSSGQCSGECGSCSGCCGH